MRKLVIRKILFAISVILITLTVCGPALADSPLQPGPEDLQQEQAMRAASEKFIAAGNVTENELALYTVQAELWPAEDAAPNLRAWTVVFNYAGKDDLFFSVRVASPSGKVIEYGPETFAQDMAEYLAKEADRKMILDNTALWEKEKGPEYFWPYEDKALFFETFGHAAGYTTMKPGLPGSGDLSMQQAVELARDAAMKEFGVTEEQLDALKRDYTFLPDTFRQLDGTACSIWMIAFRYAAPDLRGLNRIKYQVNIVSPQGEIDLIVDHEKETEQDEQGMNEAFPHLTVSIPEGTGNIFYNPNGGKYYHADQNCKIVKDKYLPLKPLNTDKLKEYPFSNLRPCPSCIGH